MKRNGNLVHLWCKMPTKPRRIKDKEREQEKDNKEKLKRLVNALRASNRLSKLN